MEITISEKSILLLKYSIDAVIIIIILKTNTVPSVKFLDEISPAFSFLCNALLSEVFLDISLFLSSVNENCNNSCNPLKLSRKRLFNSPALFL